MQLVPVLQKVKVSDQPFQSVLHSTGHRENDNLKWFEKFLFEACAEVYHWDIGPFRGNDYEKLDDASYFFLKHTYI